MALDNINFLSDIQGDVLANLTKAIFYARNNEDPNLTQVFDEFGLLSVRKDDFPGEDDSVEINLSKVDYGPTRSSRREFSLFEKVLDLPNSDSGQIAIDALYFDQPNATEFEIGPLFVQELQNAVIEEKSPFQRAFVDAIYWDDGELYIGEIQGNPNPLPEGVNALLNKIYGLVNKVFLPFELLSEFTEALGLEVNGTQGDFTQQRAHAYLLYLELSGIFETFGYLIDEGGINLYDQFPKRVSPMGYAFVDFNRQVFDPEKIQDVIEDLVQTLPLPFDTDGGLFDIVGRLKPNIVK